MDVRVAYIRPLPDLADSTMEAASPIEAIRIELIIQLTLVSISSN